VLNEKHLIFFQIFMSNNLFNVLNFSDTEEAPEQQPQ
jgi:hypothetical protein